jgi:hypothetical protein
LHSSTDTVEILGGSKYSHVDRTNEKKRNDSTAIDWWCHYFSDAHRC